MITMTAFARPSLRSSSRHITGLDALPATDIQHHHGKRTRDALSGNRDKQPFKRQKIHAQDFSPLNSRNRFEKDFPVVPRKVGRPPLTHLERSSRHPDRVPLPSHNVSAITTIGKHSSFSSSLSSTAATKAHRPGVEHDGLSHKIDKRNLRSHDGGSRSKSELALYFPNYDELLSIEAKDPDFLNAETRIHIVDELSKPTSSNPTTNNYAIHKPPLIRPQRSTVNGFARSLDSPDENVPNLTNAQRVDFSAVERHTQHETTDPLSDAMYFKAHRRAERQEKQLRNIEKERAQHEKVQLERLLDGLKGHDWLRVMGISGITDSEKRVFEPKRDFFVQEVSVLIDKFKMWKEEEKRRKLEREQNLLAEDDEASESHDETNTVRDSPNPDFSDVDTCAAKQLHQEAFSAKGLQRGRKRRNQTQVVTAAPVAEKPFTSFYSKSYLRDATVGKHRRGRTRFAFGQPLPKVVEKPFSLPPSMLSQEVLAASARSRRRARRESKDG